MLVAKNSRKVHVIAWSIFCSYEILLSAVVTGTFSHPLYYLLFFPLNILSFYFTANFIYPRTLKTYFGKFILLPIFLVLECVVYLGFVWLFSYTLDLLHLREMPTQVNFRFFAIGFWRWINFVIYALGYYYLRQYLVHKQKVMDDAIENERIKANLVTAEVNFLKSQINPHLLFNTLNFVKFAAKKKPEEANEAIVMLADIMRFVLEQSNNETIPLQKELDQIENLINLNKLRFDNRIYIRYDLETNHGDQLILPSVLYTLTENIFKHGNLVDENAVASIEIITDSEKLVFRTANLVNHIYTPDSTKTGLKNIEQRLSLHYSDNFTLKYGAENEVFFSELMLPFNPSKFDK